VGAVLKQSSRAGPELLGIRSGRCGTARGPHPPHSAPYVCARRVSDLGVSPEGDSSIHVFPRAAFEIATSTTATRNVGELDDHRCDSSVSR